MLLRQVDEIANAASAGLKQASNAGQKEAASNRACLNEGKPIVAGPIHRGHVPIIPNPAPVSSV